jgi:hypothetical protein
MTSRMVVGVLIALLVISPAFSATSAPPDQPRTARGVLTELNLVDRTGIIGGFSYQFGTIQAPLKVRMYQSEAGVVEMLSPGMKVEVVYLDTGDTRVALSLDQLSDDEVVEF